jgi:hypothetical protein
MRKSFSSAVAIFWAVLFGAVTYGLIVDFQASAQSTVAVLGATIALPGPGATMFAAFVLAVCFALASVLFFWGFMLAFLGAAVEEREQADILASAHAVAAVGVVMVLAATIILPGQPAFGPLVLQIGSLAASFLACQMQTMVSSQTDSMETDEVVAAAKFMASGAAHNTMLSRITGRERPIAKRTR